MGPRSIKRATKRTTAKLPVELHKRILKAKVEHDTTIDLLVEKAVLTYLDALDAGTESTNTPQLAPSAFAQDGSILSAPERQLLDLLRDPQDIVEERFGEMIRRTVKELRKAKIKETDMDTPK